MRIGPGDSDDCAPEPVDASGAVSLIEETLFKGVVARELLDPVTEADRFRNVTAAAATRDAVGRRGGQ